MANKRITGLEEDALIVGGIGIAGYLLLRHTLPSLFGHESPEDRQLIDDQQSDVTSDNIFLGTSDSYQQWFSPIETTLFDQFGVTDFPSLYLTAYRTFLNGELSTDNPLYSVCQIYHQLHGSVTGHLFTGDQDGANEALNMITNKWQLGALAELWAYEAGGTWGSADSLFKSIRNGSFPMQYGLNPTDLAAQIRRLNNLPD